MTTSSAVAAIREETHDLLRPPHLRDVSVDGGVDVYFLSKKMGRSVKMIEDHYSHVSPVKNAERILQGLPGWEPISAMDQVAEGDRANDVPSKRRRKEPSG